MRLKKFKKLNYGNKFVGILPWGIRPLITF